MASTKGVGHAEVRADDVDDGLTLVGIVLGEAFEGVKTAQAHGCFFGTKLIDGFGIEVGDPALGRIQFRDCGKAFLVEVVSLIGFFPVGLVAFLKPLAASSEEQGGGSARTGGDSEAGFDGLDTEVGAMTSDGQEPPSGRPCR